MKNLLLILFVCAGVLIQSPSTAQDIKVEDFDKAGIDVLNTFMKAIMDNQGDEIAAARAALPVIHKSEYDDAGSCLKKDRLDYSFKKAWQNAKFYKTPVVITRVQKQNLTAIGFGATAEKGTAYKVWIAKNDGVAGLPAPLNVFFPADGSAPKIYYYGSL
jgi:hypothetical protein